jgi:uncharacterized Zn-finger protein
VQHIRSAHQGERHACTHLGCDKNYTNRSHLTRHLQLAHGTGPVLCVDSGTPSSEMDELDEAAMDEQVEEAVDQQVAELVPL